MGGASYLVTYSIDQVSQSKDFIMLNTLKVLWYFMTVISASGVLQDYIAAIGNDFCLPVSNAREL